MPYIDHKSRKRIDTLYFHNDDESPGLILNPGELNYCITKILNDYMYSKGLSYSTINDVVGVLECAKQEFYRRVASTYEDEKIQSNGDVY